MVLVNLVVIMEATMVTFSGKSETRVVVVFDDCGYRQRYNDLRERVLFFMV